MSVSYDGTSGASAFAASSSVSWTDNFSGNAALVTINYNDFGVATPAVTVGGTNATLLGSGVDYTTNQNIEVWGLLNPPTGSQTVSVSGVGFNCQGVSVGYSGVSSFGTPVTNSSNSSSSASVGPVSSGSGHVVFCAFTSTNGGAAAGTFSSFSGTTRVNVNSSNSGWPVLVGEATGGSVSFTATAPFANFGAYGVDLVGSGADPGAGAQTTTTIPNPYVGPTALRKTKRMPYLPNFVAPPIPPDPGAGAQLTSLIPNPFVGPAALRQQKRMPYWTPRLPPPGVPAAPFLPLIQKLNTGQSVSINTVGDSTVHGFGGTNNDGGWPLDMGVLLGQYYDVTVNYYDVSPGTGYGSATTVYTSTVGHSNTISIYNGGINASGLEGFGNEEYYMVNGGLLQSQFSGLGTPDVLIAYDGYNDISNGSSITQGQWIASVETYLTGQGTGNGGVPNGYLGLINYLPGVPIIWCTQHTSFTGNQSVWYSYQSAVANALTGSSLPLYPGVQLSNNNSIYPNVWVLDTQQALTGWTSDLVENGDPHLSALGYLIVAQWMLSQLAPLVVSSIYTSQARTAVQIANSRVGPMALRQNTRLPVPPGAQHSFSDSANLSWVFGSAGPSGSTQGLVNNPGIWFDATGVGGTNAGNTSPITITYSHVITGSCIVIALSGWGSAGGTEPTSPPITRTVTVGGSNAPLISGPVQDNNTSGFPWLEFYGLINPPTGPQTITITLTGAGNQLFAQANSVSYGGVAMFGVGQTTVGNSNSMTQTVSSAPGQWVVQAFQNGFGSAAIASYNKTSRWNSTGLVSLVDGDPIVLGDTQGASSLTFTATSTGNTQYSGVAVTLIGPQNSAPVIIPNPFVGPMALRALKHMPYVPYRAASGAQAFSDVANASWVFSTPTDGFIDHPGAQTSVIIPSPLVGPMAMRSQKRFPYVASQKQGYVDGANQTVTFTATDDGFVDHPGAKTSVAISNPLVGPTALRQGKRMPYVSYQKQGFTDAANQTLIFTATDDGFVDHPGAQTTVVIPNRFVGPTALRQRNHFPYVASQKQGYTDAANQAIAFTLTDDGFVDHPGAATAILIPNPFVGPQALRNQKRMPYVAYRAQSGAQAFSDAANSSWVFVINTDGSVDHPGAKTAVLIPNPFVGPQALRGQKRMPYVSSQKQGFTDAANQAITFTLTDDGFVDHPGAQTAILIPNPNVGPQALRNLKHMPYVAYRAIAGAQAFSDAANATWVFTLPSDGFVDHPGAQTSIIIPNPLVGPQALRARKGRPYVAQQRQGYVDLANTTWTFGRSTDGQRGVLGTANSTWTFSFSTQGVRGARDAANLVITFATSDDGYLDHPGAKTAVVIANPNVGPQALRHSKHWPYVSSVHGPGQPVLGSADTVWTFNMPTDGQVVTIDLPIENIVLVGPNETRIVPVTPGINTVQVGPNEVRITSADQP